MKLRLSLLILVALLISSLPIVAQEDTLMRMAERPFHVVPPAQHVPSRCTRRMTSWV